MIHRTTAQNSKSPRLTDSFIEDPTHDPYAAKIDYKNNRLMVGANYSTEASYLYQPMHHYKAIPRNYARDRRCQFALRLTKA